MFEETRADLARDAENVALPEAVRRAAVSALTALEAYARIRLAEARRPTDPAGHTLVKPRTP